MSSNNPSTFNGNANGSNSNNSSTATNNVNSINGQPHAYLNATAADSASGKTLYVGNLDPQINEDLILALFSQIGAVSTCKIIHEPGNDPYAFVEFYDHNTAATALLTMNKRVCFGRDLKVNWATSSGSNNNQPKMDTSKHHHIFVGDLSSDIDTPQLKDAFLPFGEISDCRVVRDTQTLKSKGYGFVSFVKKADAESAIQTMNGQWIGSRAIRTNWATRKPPTSRTNPLDISTSSTLQPVSNSPKQLTFEEVYQQSSATNCTVYCGGITVGLTDELIQKTFYPFGSIHEIRVFKDKGYAFIKFHTKEAATNAIVTIHNSEINGQSVKCSWGKESIDSANPTAANSSLNAAQYNYAYQYAGWPYTYPGYSQHAAFTQATVNQFGAAAIAQNPSTAALYGYNPYLWQGALAAGQQSGNLNNLNNQPGLQTAHQTSGNLNNLNNLPQPNAAAMMGGYQMSTYQAQ